MLTYNLFKTQSTLLSAARRKVQPNADLHSVQNPVHAFLGTNRKGQLDVDLHPVEIPEHDLVSNKPEVPTGFLLTCCSKPRPCSCQQHAGRASQMLTYSLFKTQSIILSATSRKDQSDADLHAAKNPVQFLLATSKKG